MKTRKNILTVFAFLLFITGMLISNKSIIANEMYNTWGSFLELAALIIIIIYQKNEISELKKQIKELEINIK